MDRSFVNYQLVKLLLMLRIKELKIEIIFLNFRFSIFEFTYSLGENNRK